MSCFPFLSSTSPFYPNFETGPHSVAQADLKSAVLLLLEGIASFVGEGFIQSLLIGGTGLFVLLLSCQDFLFKMTITFLPSLSSHQIPPHCPSSSWSCFFFVITYIHAYTYFFLISVSGTAHPLCAFPQEGRLYHS